MSSVRKIAGWFATIPTLFPPRRASPTMRSGVISVHLEERALVGHRVHQVVRRRMASGRTRDEAVERLVLAVDAVVVARRGGPSGRCWEDSRQLADESRQSRSSGTEKCATPSFVVRLGAAELFLRHFLVRDCPQHVRPGDEHVARALDHDVEVGDRRRNTAPPAHGPMIAEIRGMTPDASVFLRKMSA